MLMPDFYKNNKPFVCIKTTQHDLYAWHDEEGILSVQSVVPGTPCHGWIKNFETGAIDHAY